LPGRFLFDGRSSGENEIRQRFPAVRNFFSWEPWNQTYSNVLKDFGLGSIFLILLHHPLFQLDLCLDGQSYDAESHTSIQIRCDLGLEETP